MSATRKEVEEKIEKNDLDGLLYLTGLIHGHHCVGSAMGVIAAHYAMKEMGIKESTGMEHVIALVETNSCFSDGVQLVTGCTFGNNSLVYHDIGKTAFSLVRRDGNGIRLTRKQDLGDLLKDKRPEALMFSKLVNERDVNPEEEARIIELNKEHCYRVLEIPAEKIFDVEEVKVDLPGYSRILGSLVCPSCGEKFMENKAVKKGDESLCPDCGGEYGVLDWDGINFVCKETE
ncbi:formylmethanofuran dehydrogenase [Candidatus Bathyarchaeota archaeon]|nr:formylmethanofuran dehydrogenase [Candidatus Bathyarchaeota archaeon]